MRSMSVVRGGEVSEVCFVLRGVRLGEECREFRGSRTGVCGGFWRGAEGAEYYC